MGKGGGDTQPDPFQTAQAQTEANRAAAFESAQLNQINQVTPFGSVSFTGGIGTPGRTQTTTLSPDEQLKLQLRNALTFGVGNFALDQVSGLPTGPLTAESIGAVGRSVGPGAPQLQQALPGFPQGAVQQGIGDQSIQTRGGIQGGAGQGITGFVDPSMQIRGGIQGAGQGVGGQFNRGQGVQGGLQTGGLQGISGLGDFSAERQRAEETAFNRLTGRIDEDFETQRGKLEQRLADQGIPVGSEASMNVMRDLSRQRTDVRSEAADRAFALGGQEQSRMFGQSLAARQQGFGEAVQGGQFANLAAGQQFGQGLGAAQFANQAQQQGFGQNLAAGQFQNLAQQQQFGQGLGAAQFANQAQQQGFGQNLAAGQFQNQAAQQQLAGALASGQFANQAQQQQFGQNLGAGQFANTAALQQFGAGQGQAQFQNQVRAQQFQEAQGLRAQQLNELAQALGGTQVQGPQANPLASFQMAPADIAGLIQQDADRRAQSQSGTMGALAGLAGSALPLMFSDSRLKKSVKKIGSLMKGIHLYSYRYLWDDSTVNRIGVMAQEVKKVMPKAVSVDAETGFMKVDYNILAQGA